MMILRSGILSLFICLNTAAFCQCIEGNCENGSGTHIYPSGAKYNGEFKNNKANGFGELVFPNGDEYIGDWTMHQRTGKGKLFKNGQLFYEGDFYKNKFHGFGIQSLENGDTYIGDFNNNKYHGQGIYTAVSGNIAIGEWSNGRPFEIELKNKLTKSKNSQTKIKDCNQNYCHNETGKYVYPDSTTFVGDFKNGDPFGPGKVIYVNGDIYEGGWENHAPHGEGVVNYINGKVVGAIWNYGYPMQELTASHKLIREQVKIDRNEDVKIWAVVIGISRYNHMPTLRYTDDDAFHLYALLKSPEGGAVPENQISLLIDEKANRKEIISSLQQTFYKADENDVVILYFSGHGLEGKMIPSDYDGFNNSILYEELKDILDQSLAANKIIITDACHSGSLLASKSALDIQMTSFYQKISKSSNGIAFMTSSKGEEVSLESTGLRHGVFSNFLIKGLKGAADNNSDSIIDISELFDYVYNNVTTYTDNLQNPMLFGNFDKNMPVSFIRN